MATTDADTYGIAIITARGAAAEYTTYPMLKSAERFAAAMAYQAYLNGNVIPRGASASPGQFARFADDMMLNFVLPTLDLTAVGWPQHPARAAFNAANVATFPGFAA